jgi:hypothetical protein
LTQLQLLWYNTYIKIEKLGVCFMKKILMIAFFGFLFSSVASADKSEPCCSAWCYIGSLGGARILPGDPNVVNPNTTPNIAFYVGDAACANKNACANVLPTSVNANKVIMCQNNANMMGKIIPVVKCTQEYMDSSGTIYAMPTLVTSIDCIHIPVLKNKAKPLEGSK